MEKNFIFLTRVSDPECELICQRLREARIKYQIKSPPEEGAWSRYGAQWPSIGKEIYVLTSELERAKELLGLKKEGFSISKWRFPLIIRMLFFVILLILLLWFILGTSGILYKPVPDF